MIIITIQQQNTQLPFNQNKNEHTIKYPCNRTLLNNKSILEITKTLHTEKKAYIKA